MKILYQDTHILVLEKPTGVPSCPVSPKALDSNNVESLLQKKYPGAKLVHRLDNETSGLMVAAKNRITFEKLREIWNTDQVQKTYTALVHGHPPLSGKIETPIAHHPRKKKKMMVGGAKTRPAQTKYKTIKKFKNFSLLSVEITTGVRHQIRVHLASIGHPVVGDKLYARKQTKLNVERHYLHLSQIQLTHPTTNKKMKFISSQMLNYPQLTSAK